MPKKMFRWIFDLNKLGISTDVAEDITRKIAFSNVVFISLPIVYFFFMAIDYESFLQPIYLLRFDQLIVPIVILICFLCLFLNKWGFTTISRVLFIVQWPFLLHIIPLLLLETPIDYYVAFPMGIVFHSVLIQLMFSHRKEAWIFWSFLAFNFVTLFFSADILAFFVVPGTDPNEIIYDKYFLLDNVLYWLLFNLVVFYTLIVIEDYIKKINNSKIVIESQKEELNRLNKDLGKMVSERTLKLAEQNEKLRGYAFYNAHLLRAPFCRIQGLFQLLNMTENHTENDKEVIVRLEDSIQELELVLKQIRHIVDEEV